MRFELCGVASPRKWGVAMVVGVATGQRAAAARARLLRLRRMQLRLVVLPFSDCW